LHKAVCTGSAIAPASPIPIESATPVIPNENSLFSNGTWKQIPQSEKILSKENQIWRVKTNKELDKMIKHKNIINYIKAHRLSWFGHVQRMPDTRTVKKIFNWKPPNQKITRKTPAQMGG